MGASRLRVVLAENGLTEAGLTLRSVCAEIGSTLELVRVERREELERAMRAYRPDVALLRLSLLQPDAVHELSVLQRDCPSIPLILLADPADKAYAEHCLGAGAADYLLNGYLDERTMNRVLRAAVGEKQIGAVAGEAIGGPWRRRNQREWCVRVSAREFALGEEWESAAKRFAVLRDDLRRSIRSTDTIEDVSEGELRVKVHGVDEGQISKVRDRLQSRLRYGGGSLNRFGVRVEIEAWEKERWIGPNNGVEGTGEGREGEQGSECCGPVC